MNKSHYYFGLVVGVLIMAMGAALSTLGTAGWSLAAVGLLIFAVSILNHHKFSFALRTARVE